MEPDDDVAAAGPLAPPGQRSAAAPPGLPDPPPVPVVEGVRAVEDRRRPAYGYGRVLVAVFAVMGLVVLSPAAVSLARDPSAAPLVDAVDIAVGLLFLVLAVCVAHNGRRMRVLGWTCLSALLVGAIVVGALTWAGAAAGVEGCAWTDGGVDLLYLPLILPIVGAVWMWMSDPRRIVINAERRDELGAALEHRARPGSPQNR